MPCSAACNGTRHLLSTCSAAGAPASADLGAYSGWFVAASAACNTGMHCGAATPAASYYLALPPDPGAASGGLAAYAAASGRSVSTGSEVGGSGDGVGVTCGYGCTIEPPLAAQCRCVLQESACIFVQL